MNREEIEYIKSRQGWVDKVLFYLFLLPVLDFFLIGFTVIDGVVKQSTIVLTVVFGMLTAVSAVCRHIYHVRKQSFSDDYYYLKKTGWLK